MTKKRSAIAGSQAGIVLRGTLNEQLLEAGLDDGNHQSLSLTTTRTITATISPTDMTAAKNTNTDVRAASSLLQALGASTARERQFLLQEILHVKGLMPLLMKQRNRQPWSAEEKAELTQHLKRLSRLSPYLVAVAMPGGFLLLPALAWWLDRRRQRANGN